MASDTLPIWIRTSVGSATVLNLLKGKNDVLPTTAYLMTYLPKKCTANCLFCPQGRSVKGGADKLSRITWPKFSTTEVITRIALAFSAGQIYRACIQALNYKEVFDHLISISKMIKKKSNIPLSLSCQPLTKTNIKQLALAGIERISIPIDAATKELFNKIKGFSAGGPYIWNNQFKLLKYATNIFGVGNVTTHLIVGLGETEREMLKMIQHCVANDVYPALFAFTPIPGTLMGNNPPPSIQSYRRIQIARFLIVNRIIQYKDLTFGSQEKLVKLGVKKSVLLESIQTGNPFVTSGCPSCNRPFYNEKPKGPIYNYPRKLTDEEINVITSDLHDILV